MGGAPAAAVVVVVAAVVFGRRLHVGCARTTINCASESSSDGLGPGSLGHQVLQKYVACDATIREAEQIGFFPRS